MKYIRDYYGVPAKRGARIRYTGSPEPISGTVVAARDARLHVRLDGIKHIARLHPTWEVEYLEDAK